MKKQKTLLKKMFGKLIKARKRQQGSALIIVSLVLALLTIYVSASLMNATSDAVSSNFEVAKKKAFFSAYSKLEQMTGDFSNLFLTSLSPSYDSMCQVVVRTPTTLNGFDLKVPKVNCPPNSPCTSLPGDDPTQKYMVGTNLFDLGWEGDPPPPSGFCLVDVCHPNAEIKCGYPLRPTNAVTIPRGDYAGLQGFARRFRMVATARAQSAAGADVQVTRDFNNYLIPAFQFGIFSDTDFELYIPPPWNFGGWVHTNGNFYATGDFSGGSPRNVFRQYAFDNTGAMVPTAARITIAKHMIIGKEKSGANGDNNGEPDFIQVFTSNTASTRIYEGTSTAGARNAGSPAGTDCKGLPTSEDTPDADCTGNVSFATPVKVGVRPLRLPIQNLLGLSAIEIIKRGLPSDYAPTIASPLIAARYYYKPGIRVTLADYQNQLPRQVKANENPASGTGDFGGIQLDGPDPWLAENVDTGTTSLTRTGSDPANDPNWYYMKDDPTDPNSTIKNYKWPIPRGYQPKVKQPTTGEARPTGARINGARIHGWIKVELVRANGQTHDITEEFLNLGLTVPFQADTANTSFYYPRPKASVGFPPALPLDMSTGQKAGPYPDENSILHIQRMAVAYRRNVDDGPDVSGTAKIADLESTAAFGAVPDNITAQTAFDYYSSMALGRYNNPSSNGSLQMYGIRDDGDERACTSCTTSGGPRIGRKRFMTRYDTTGLSGTGLLETNAPNPAPYAEPQPDPGGYYTHALRAALPISNPHPNRTQIDFTGAGGATRPASETNNFYIPASITTPTPTDTFIIGKTYNTAGFALSENANLPKRKNIDGTKEDGKVLAVTKKDFKGETTWRIKLTSTQEFGLVPFPINIYDSREGLPHQASGGTSSANYSSKRSPLPGIEKDAVNKPGVMNLLEIDMGNLGRFLKGDFDALFSQMGDTAYKKDTLVALKASTALSDFTDLIHENIRINQDNGWIIYVSDRRGDEPMVSTNNNLKPPLGQYPGSPNNGVVENIYSNPTSVIGDGAYHRENVIWTGGGSLSTGNRAEGLSIKTDVGTTKYGCDNSNPANPIKSDNQDNGKSPQDSNNDCFIASEDGRGAGAANYSETASYSDIFDTDQSIVNWPSGNLDYKPTITSVNDRRGNVVAMTQVGTVSKRPWSYKPPVAYRDSANDQRVELFRRAIRTVNASNLFPTGPVANTICGTVKLGVSLATENPVYVFGNFNAPAGRNQGVVVDEDAFPGINVNTPGTPTFLNAYNGQDFATCGINCHVPASIVADALTLLSGPNVGTGTPGVFANWSGANGTDGWLDTRTFVRPYQAIEIRTARNTVYRFALITGFTPSWYPGFWGNSGWNQGPDSEYTSGALNNFPRFLEDWSSGSRYATYGGSLIRAFKSQQANGAFKRVSIAGSQSQDNDGDVDYVYVPPRRDWVFDLDFSRPCTLPPATPFLQLVDFKGFQESSVQQREQ